MKHGFIGAVLAALVVLPGGDARGGGLGATLSGMDEIPPVFTDGTGTFNAEIDESAGEIRYSLSYADLEGLVTEAHLQFGQPGVNGQVIVYLCSNLTNVPRGTRVCPMAPGAVTGVIEPFDVIGPVGQGINPGDFDKLVDAIHAGATYVKVRTALYPAGEIRGQVGGGTAR